MADRKSRMILLSRYNKLHNARHTSRSDININKEQWAADALIESYGLEGCLDLLGYYFEASASPSWNYFAYNADKVIHSKSLIEEDKKERLERANKAREWLSG